MSISTLAKALTPLCAAMVFNAERRELIIQETGKNPLSTPISFFKEQQALWFIINLSRNTPFSWHVTLGGVTLSTALFIIGQTPILKYDFVKERLPEPVIPYLPMVEKAGNAVYKYHSLATRVTSIAICFILMGKKRVFGGVTMLAVLAIHELRLNTNFITDSMLNTINSTAGKVTSIILIFNVSCLLSLRILYNIITSQIPHYVRRMTGNGPLSLNPTLEHEKEGDGVNLADYLLSKPETPLCFDPSYRRRQLAHCTRYDETKANSAQDLVERTKAILDRVKREIGEDKYLELMIRYYLQRKGISTKDRERLNVLQKAWFEDLCDIELQELEKKLALELDEDINAKQAQWESALSLKTQIELLKQYDPQPPVLAQLEKRFNTAVKEKEEYEKKLQKVKYEKDISKIRKNMEERKKQYLEFFPKHFIGLLEQLNTEVFRQGGTLPIEQTLKQITFLMGEVEAEERAEDKLHLLMVMMERSNFCNEAITDMLYQLVSRRDTFVDSEVNTLKNKVHYIERKHRERRCLLAANERVKISFRRVHAAQALNKDTHVIYFYIAIMNVSHHFSPEFCNKAPSLMEYIALRIIDFVLLMPAFYTFFINPNETISEIYSKLQENKMFRKEVDTWKKNYAASLREKGEEDYDQLAERLEAMPVQGASADVFPLVKVLLVDMGIFTYSSFNPYKKFFIPPTPTATATDMDTVVKENKEAKEEFTTLFSI